MCTLFFSLSLFNLLYCIIVILLFFDSTKATVITCFSFSFSISDLFSYLAVELLAHCFNTHNASIISFLDTHLTHNYILFLQYLMLNFTNHFYFLFCNYDFYIMLCFCFMSVMIFFFLSFFFWLVLSFVILLLFG